MKVSDNYSINHGKVEISKEKSLLLEQRLLNEHKNVRKVAINVNWKNQDGQETPTT